MVTNYNFTYDFREGPYSNILSIFKEFGTPTKMIEVGSYEGRTSLWISDNMHELGLDLEVFMIDPHIGSDDIPHTLKEIRENFINNLEYVKIRNPKHKVHHLDKTSTEGLLELIQKKEKVDFIYVDGDHKSCQVLTDLVLSWELLKENGVILCDDVNGWQFTDKNGVSAAQLSPKMAVEAFIQCNWHKIRVLKLPDSSQAAFVKLKD